MSHKNNSPLIISGLLILIVLAFGIFGKKSESDSIATQPLVDVDKKTSSVAMSHFKQTKTSAKNLILLIGDGMGYNHVTAGSYYAQGRKKAQVYQNFPARFGMSTYMAVDDYDPATAWGSFDAVNSGATDSAAAATAMATGEKTYRYGVGVDCQRNPLANVIEQVELKGKATGVVTSVQFSHATPAAFVAHNITRRNYEEMAREMILNSTTDVIMGGGHPLHGHSGEFLERPKTFQFVGGEKLWNDLQLGVIGNDADGDGVNDPWTLIESRQAFQNLMQGTVPNRVIGVARVAQTLQQKRQLQGDVGYGAEPQNASATAYSTPLTETVPTLEEMTKGALNVLDNNPDGFFMMVEGGAIDWASHANQSDRVIEEQVDFDNAVTAVVDWVERNSSWDETLVIVTADHETGYLTGPGSDPTWEAVMNNGKGRVPGMEWHSVNHTNSLVPLYAKGPSSWSFAEHVVGHDSERGAYIDNTALYPIMLQAIQD